MPVSPTRIRNGKRVPNPRYVEGEGIKIHNLSYYGDPDRLIFAMQFIARQYRLKIPKLDIHTSTLKELSKRFNITESTARKDLVGLRAYRSALFHQQLPSITAELYHEFQRLARVAESNGDIRSAILANDKIAKLTGAYAPEKLSVEHTVSEGPSLQDQLRSMLSVVSPEAQAGLERFLAELEVAKADGRLQLPSAPDDEQEPAETVVDIVGEGSVDD